MHKVNLAQSLHFTRFGQMTKYRSINELNLGKFQTIIETWYPLTIELRIQQLYAQVQSLQHTHTYNANGEYLLFLHKSSLPSLQFPNLGLRLTRTQMPYTHFTSINETPTVTCSRTGDKPMVLDFRSLL